MQKGKSISMYLQHDTKEALNTLLYQDSTSKQINRIIKRYTTLLQETSLSLDIKEEDIRILQEVLKNEPYFATKQVKLLPYIIEQCDVLTNKQKYSLIETINSMNYTEKLTLIEIIGR